MPVARILRAPWTQPLRMAGLLIVLVSTLGLVACADDTSPAVSPSTTATEASTDAPQQPQFFTVYYECTVEQRETPFGQAERDRCPHDGVYQCAPESPDPFCPDGYFGWVLNTGAGYLTKEPLPCTPPEGTPYETTVHEGPFDAASFCGDT